MTQPQPLSILLTNIRMSMFGGTQTFTRDLAIGLRRAGHRPQIYTPRLGVVSEELSAAGVPVYDRLGRIEELPHVIHGNQHAELVACIAHFRETPALFTCHSPVDLCDSPPHLQRIRHFVAVDRIRRERLLRERWIETSDVSIVENAIDLERFPLHPASPSSKPLTALLLSNHATTENFGGRLNSAAGELGLRLEIAGRAFGSTETNITKRLENVDVVFAVGRSAIEAMACGKACILCDRDGIGPMVSSGNVAYLREYNFGRAMATDAISREALRNRLDQYNPEDIRNVQHYIRSENGLERMVQQYERLYRRVMDDRRALPELGDDFRKYSEYTGSVVAELILQRDGRGIA